MNKRLSKELMSMYERLFARFGPQHWWPGRTKTEIAIGAILTQNTNWENVKKAIANLRRERLLDFNALDRMSAEQIAPLIRSSGYYNIKAKRLKNFIDFFQREYKGSWAKAKRESLPVLREKMLAVNGVGPETVDSILLYAMDLPIFVVDAYTKRLLAQHRLMTPDADYHAVQRLFMDNIPSDVQLYNEFHGLIVRAAKEHCHPKPSCQGCPLKTPKFKPKSS